MRDLLDMAGPSGLPSFMDVANGMRPQMQPLAPSSLHALGYAQDATAHRAMIQKAAGLAQLKAMMDAQKADEFSRAGPGRMAEIDVRNATSRADAEDIPNILEERRGKRRGAISEQRMKEVERQMKGLEKYIDSWEMLSPEEQQFMHREMKQEGATFGNKKLGDAPIEEVGKLMKALRVARERSPDIMKEEAKGRVRKTLQDDRQEHERDMQADKERLAVMLKRMGFANAQAAKPYVEELRRRFGNGEILTPRQMELLNADYAVRSYSTEVRAATTPGTLTVKDGKVEREKPQIPAPPRVGESEQYKGKAPPAALEKLKKLRAAAQGNKAELAKIDAEWKKTFNEDPPK